MPPPRGALRRRRREVHRGCRDGCLGNRFHARLGDGDPDADYRTAAAIFAGRGLLFHHAVAQLEHAEWLPGQGRTEDAQPLLAQARSTFEDLEAGPWLERADTSRAPRGAEVPA